MNLSLRVILLLLYVLMMSYLHSTRPKLVFLHWPVSPPPFFFFEFLWFWFWFLDEKSSRESGFRSRSSSCCVFGNIPSCNWGIWYRRIRIRRREVILEFWPPPSPPTPPFDWHRQLLVATDSCINELEPWSSRLGGVFFEDFSWLAEVISFSHLLGFWILNFRLVLSAKRIFG